MVNTEMEEKSRQWRQGINFVRLLLLSMVVASVIAYSFLTDFYPKKSAAYITHRKTYKEIIKKRDAAIENAIIGSDVELLITEIKATSNLELQNFTTKLNTIKKRDSFLGYDSFRVFLLSTSSSLLGFVISLFFLFMVVKYVNDLFMKRYYLITAFVFVVTTGYWLAWSVLYFVIDPSRGFDFPKPWYYAAIYVLPTFVFVAAYFLFKHYNSLEVKLKNGIKLLITYVFIDLFAKINEEDKKEVFINNMNTLDRLNKTIK